MKKPKLFDLDRLDWLVIWTHYKMAHAYNVAGISLSYETNGAAGVSLYWDAVHPSPRWDFRGLNYMPLSFSDFAGLDRLRPGDGPGRWYGTWPPIYNYYNQTFTQWPLESNQTQRPHLATFSRGLTTVSPRR